MKNQVQKNEYIYFSELDKKLKIIFSKLPLKTLFLEVFLYISFLQFPVFSHSRILFTVVSAIFERASSVKNPW